MPPTTETFRAVTVSDIGSVRTIDRYEIGRLLGTGNFASVHAATDPALDAPVAIKVLAENHSADPEIRERFVREARLQRRAASDRLVTIHDVGEHDGRPYLVMQLVEGGTLADRWPDRAVSNADVLRVIDELEACLVPLHGAGIVHRDIKPSNLLVNGRSVALASGTDPLLADDESLVLGDLGLARDLAATNLTLGAGTTGWMAPEQGLPTAEIDHRADLYAASMVVATLVTGASPAIVDEQLDEVPAAVRDELRTGLAHDPAKRPRDAAEWAERLRRAVRSSGDRDLASPVGRRPLMLGLVGLLIVVTLIVGWSIAGRGDTDSPTILGPRDVAVGEEVVFVTDADPGEVVVWTDWTGRQYERPEFRIVAERPGRLPISVSHRTESGDVATASIEIDVSG